MVSISQFEEESQQLKSQLDSKLLTEEAYYAARDALAQKFAASTIKLEADILKSEEARRKTEETLDKKKLADYSSTLGTISTLTQTSSRELFALGKAASIAQASINMYEGISKAWSLGPIAGPILAPLVAVAGAAQIANIAATNPSFENGGIVPGTSFSGDRVMANVNSGEMILNRNQQANLFKQIRSGVGGDLEETNSLLRSLIAKDSNVSVQVGGKTVVDTLRSELASGRRFQ